MFLTDKNIIRTEKLLAEMIAKNDNVNKYKNRVPFTEQNIRIDGIIRRITHTHTLFRCSQGEFWIIKRSLLVRVSGLIVFISRKLPGVVRDYTIRTSRLTNLCTCTCIYVCVLRVCRGISRLVPDSICYPSFFVRLGVTTIRYDRRARAR